MDKCEFEYLGPYKIESVLGRGGMGTVYKGVHSKSGDPVAIKVIAPGVANQMRFRRRFAAEVETLKRLRHPNIVQLIGYGEEQGLLFYSMEYVDGHSLHDHLRQFKKLDWTEVIQVGIEVAAALKHAHDMGIIHRDLKPANLMLTGDSHIKLTDFGIAKLFGATDMTAVGSVIGTADFMPPEQAEGKNVTVRSDLYSLGSVLYALMAGRAPFAGKSLPEVLYAVRYSPPPDSTPLAPDAPADLHCLIAEMLAKDPLKRPPTALVIGNRLKAIQQGVASLGAERTRPTTTSQDAPGTVIGKELTSIDLNDEHDEELKATGHAATQDQPTAIASESVIARLARSPSPTRPRSQHSSLSVDVPHSASSRSDTLPSIDQPLPASVSHYTPVNDADSKKFSLGGGAVEEESGIDWVHYGSMIALGLLLLLAAGSAYYFLQPRSADDLHAEIAQAVESGDESELSGAAGVMHEFVDRFPSDPRSEEIKHWLDEIDLLRASRKIRLNARAGSQSLPAIDQGFLSCVEAMSHDSAEAQRKFEAFVAIYKPASDLSRTEKRYVELAEFAASNLLQKRGPTVSVAAAQLESLIRNAEEKLPKTQLPGFYKSIIELYADKPWAKDAVNRVRSLAE